MRRLNADQRVECGLFLLVLRDGALQLDRDLLTLAGVDGCRQLGAIPQCARKWSSSAPLIENRG
ncbi:hypothetical protein BMJ34_08525 [Sinorhizobium medicae]|uniref:Uncharacterized protein n=2 Tax=Sinorhizobium medicae TaxID=110321 RepID=A0ABX4TG72_9HYPH|nr:hypothetical protein [Sinorhizobium medicae]MDX0568449.1 hypothetical protein [Sinorhizobium medicae]MDX0581086.1 hypothetical protein [Sinorhizobium medicae]MDX0729547.1 hypothetical protein [Sinorhizobium medicae]MDX0735767.1 hypothetical protein [Sinorhizobium medicae]